MMEVVFDKLHGLGNDYIYVDLDRYAIDDLPAFARKVSDRRFGIGGDGVITYNKEHTGHYLMRIFNIDGSEGLMCGNAIRCVAKLLYERGMCTDNPMTINTRSGEKILALTVEEGQVTAARVDMGVPTVIDTAMPVGDLQGTSVSTGNPHFVRFISNDPDDYPLQVEGPQVERHPVFPDGVNYEVAQIIDRSTIKMRVWERGSGLTLACGTGATATAVAAIAQQLADSPVRVMMPGGDLSIEWSGDPADSAFMTGPATYVFQGKIMI
ncbi:MAG: diaminopimelate epimerase [Porphyromonas sp.]|nr:diaminopimelate epimerase [Porphyromonas sp.]